MAGIPGWPVALSSQTPACPRAAVAQPGPQGVRDCSSPKRELPPPKDPETGAAEGAPEQTENPVPSWKAGGGSLIQGERSPAGVQAHCLGSNKS